MRGILWLFVMALALVPSSALAQSDDERGGVVIRVNGDAALAAGDQVETLVVIRADATVDGTVHETLLVIEGDATVRGQVDDVVVIRGTLRLEAGSSVDDIHLYDSDLDQDPGATVRGDISRDSGWWSRPWAIVFGVLFFLGFGLVFFLSALLFAAVGGGQLGRAARTMTATPGQSVLGAVVLVVGLPVLAVALMVTLIGIPAGLGLLLFALPVTWLLGVVVAATWLGLLVTSRQAAPPAHPYGAAAIGAAIFLALMLVPGVGFAAISLLGLWGSGALAVVAWQAARGGRGESAAPIAAREGQE